MVGQYRARMRGYSTGKCSRSSRNDLVDLCSSEEEKDEKEKKVEKVRKAKMGKRILLKMLQKYKEEDDMKEKANIKMVMKQLDGPKAKSSNDMIHFIFDVHATDLDSCDSSEATNQILEFADDTNE